MGICRVRTKCAPYPAVRAWEGTKEQRRVKNTVYRLLLGSDRGAVCDHLTYARLTPFNRNASPSMTPLIERKQAEIAAICRELGVERLALFGSALRDDFDPERSDIDLLVALPETGDAAQYAETWLELHGRLEKLLGRQVDLVSERALTNPYFRERVLESRRPLYAS